MKRSIALLLTVIMVLGMVPASLLSAMAHGIGVGNNNINNLSIDNAPNQQVPATVIVDGKSDDTAWAYEDWNNVDSTKGLWSVTTAKNPNFSYKYQLHYDYEFLYGIFVIDTNGIFSGSLGDITVWLNDSGVTTYTDKIVLTKDGTCTVYNGTTVVSDKGAESKYGTDIYSQLCSVENKDGVYTIEFRTLLKNITEDDVPVLRSYASVAVGDEQLYYPRFETSDLNTGMDPGENWPTNAISITRWDISAANQAGYYGNQNGDFSKIAPSEIHVDGELNEGIWQNFTDYFRVDSDIYDYRHGSDADAQDGYDFMDLSVGYSSSMYYYDVEDGDINIVTGSDSTGYKLDDRVYFNGYSMDLNTSKYNDYAFDTIYLDYQRSPIKFKYDIRTDYEYLYGAVLANIDCDNEQFYYHIKKYEKENGTPADGTTLVVPTYFFVVFTALSSKAGDVDGKYAYTLTVRHNTTIRYSASHAQWRYVEDSASNETQYKNNGDGLNCTYISGGFSDGSAAVGEKIQDTVKSKRINQHLVAMEFKLSYKDLKILGDNGKYVNVDTGAYDADQFVVYHTIAMSNTGSMYDRVPAYFNNKNYFDPTVEGKYYDLVKANGGVFTFRSYGIEDPVTGEARDVQQGDVKTSTANGTTVSKKASQDAQNIWNINEGSFTSSYASFGPEGNPLFRANPALAPENAYYAFHAWSQGGGNASSKTITASKGNGVKSGADIDINGSLEPGYWANLLAADTIVNGMGKSHSPDNTTYDEYDFVNRGEANCRDGIISSFYNEIVIDDEYMYGAVIAIDDDGAWKTKIAGASYDMIRLWINTGAANSGDVYDYYANFYMDDSYLATNGYSLPVCQIFENGAWGEGAFATSTSSNIIDNNKSNAGSTDTGAYLAGHGIETQMRIVSNYRLRDIARTTNNHVNAGYDDKFVDLTVLEFKIPLSLLGITQENGVVFTYGISIEESSDSTKGLCWPLVNNAGVEEYRDVWNPSHWIVDQRSTLYNDVRLGRTYTIDGNLSEEVWNNEDERINVDTTNGTWDNLPLGEEIFDYSYKVWTGREYIYGGAVIDAELSGDDAFVLWIKDQDRSASNVVTDAGKFKFEFKIENGTGVCDVTDITNKTTTRVNFKDSAGNTAGGMAMNVINGQTYLEFMLPMFEFQAAKIETVSTQNNSGAAVRTKTFEYYDDFEYCVSVRHSIDDTAYSLYHPDNSNIGADANTNTLWLTHYNSVVKGGGVIGNSPNLISGQTTQYWTHAYFTPTQYEGVYKLEKYVTSPSTSSVTFGSEWSQVYGGNVPEGSFVYMVGSGNISNEVYGEFVNTLNYNSYSANLFKTLAGKEGSYIRFTGMDLDTYRINTLYDDQWNSDILFHDYGYATDATFTVVELDNNRTGAFFPGEQNKWDTAHQDIIEFVGYYIPEDIIIDGAVGDTGWDKDKWIYVEDKVNGNTNNTSYNKYCDSDFSYKYQIRMDDEYVYVAAVADGLSAYSTNNSGVNATPAFRIWIQSQNSEYDEAVSFTHFFDVHALATGGTGTNLYSQDNPDMLTNINAEIQAYQAHYMPVENGVNASLTVDGSSSKGLLGTNGSFGNYDWMYLGISESVIKAATHNGFKRPYGGLNNSVDALTYGDTSFYGETIFHAENENTGKNTQEYEADWYASINLTEVELADQHAVMQQDANGNMQVEFRFALSDIGCENGEDFEYYVEARSETADPASSYCLFNPSLPNESCTYGGYYARSYHLPYWVWGNTAFVVDAEAREAMRLRNPIEPITSLGAQVNESYTDAEGNTFKALKFGILYNQKYLDRVNGRTDWTGAENIYENATYWDVKELGIVLDITDYLGLDGYKTVLYTDTPFVTNEDSDAIENQKSDSNMADYESYVSYVVCKIPDGQEASNLTYRGYVEYYPHDDLYYDHWWLTDNTADDGLEDGWTFRPTYYSDPLTRNYNLVKEKADENTEIIVPVSDILVKLNISNTVTNTNHEVLEDDTFIIEIGNENGYAPYEIDGTLEFPISYSLENVGTHTYYIRQKNDGKDNVTYDDTEYTVTVDVAFDEDNNRLVPTITVNNGGSVSGNMINVSYDVTYDHTKNNTKVVYVPLDNRPVNLDRAEYLALSAGIDLVMPPESIISTTLDTSTAYGTTSSDQGDVEELFTWLQQQDADYYALSLDQLFSGGLVGSRAPFYDTEDSIARMNQTLGSYQLSAKEEEIVEYLTTLADTEGKYVVFFDTVMRLASTSGYAGMVGGEYNFLRYQYTLEDRKDLSGDALNIDQIVANYQYGANGTKLSNYFNKSGCEDYDGYGTTFSQTLVDQYCLARERKLRIADALYSGSINNVDALFIGVDDSMGRETIHTNEMNYLKQEYDLDTRDNALLFDGADELGLVALANVVSELHTNINVSVQYFGGFENEVADSYGPGTLKESVEKHIVAAGANVVTNASNADMQVLVVTRPFAKIAYFNTSGAEGYDQHVTNCTALVEKLKTNLANNIPTCVIDGTCYGGYGPLADKILAEAKAGNLALAEVMGFSAWNTTGNATGIALGNAVARVAYLKNYTVVPNEEITTTGIQSDSHTGFYKSILYSYIKDAVYKKNSGDIFAQPNKLMSIAENWIKAINTNTAMYIGINSNGYGQVANANNVRVTDITFPWNRNFEADFDFRFYAHGTDVEVENDPDNANGMSYTCDAIVSTSYPDSGKELTDGKMFTGTVTFKDAKWVGFEMNNHSKYAEVVFDFGQGNAIDLYKVSAQVMTEGIYGILPPESFEVYVMREGSNEWELVNKLESAKGHYTRVEAANEASVKAGWIGGFISGDGSNTQKVKVRFYGACAYTFVSEINIQGLEPGVS